MIRFFAVDSHFIRARTADMDSESVWELIDCLKRAKHDDNQVLIHGAALQDSLGGLAGMVQCQYATMLIEELSKCLRQRGIAVPFLDDQPHVQRPDLSFVETPPHPTRTELNAYDELSAQRYQRLWLEKPSMRSELLRRFLLGSSTVTLIDPYVIPERASRNQDLRKRAEAVSKLICAWEPCSKNRTLWLKAPTHDPARYDEITWRQFADLPFRDTLPTGLTVRCAVMNKPRNQRDHNRYLVSQFGALTLPEGWEEFVLDRGSEVTFSRVLNPAYTWIMQETRPQFSFYGVRHA